MCIRDRTRRAPRYAICSASGACAWSACFAYLTFFNRFHQGRVARVEWFHGKTRDQRGSESVAHAQGRRRWSSADERISAAIRDAPSIARLRQKLGQHLPNRQQHPWRAIHGPIWRHRPVRRANLPVPPHSVHPRAIRLRSTRRAKLRVAQRILRGAQACVPVPGAHGRDERAAATRAGEAGRSFLGHQAVAFTAAVVTFTAARIFASISSAICGLLFRYSRALSLPWPIFSPL